MDFDAVVAGAGIWGCTVARRLAEAGRSVLVLEKRPAVGGNCRCETVDGIEVHTYGSHIFHTASEDVWNFISRFTEFNGYRHCVLAKTKACNGSPSGDYHTYHLPIGCTLLREFFGREVKPSEMTDAERMQIFDAFIRGYTSKQWGVAPEKVDPSVIARLKVRDNHSTDYFDDPHQGIPAEGYNAMFGRMLDHPNITVRCNSAFRLDGNEFPASVTVYYSGPIDELFGYRFGALPWRTLRFERETLSVGDYQGNSVVNYTDAEVPYTRIHEFKHYHPEYVSFGEGRTVIMREYSSTWKLGDEPYYPIASAESASLLARYQAEVDAVNRASSNAKLVIGGRLGQYKYYDMDKAIAAALSVEL